MRFHVPGTSEDELVCARARVLERSAGLKVATPFLGGSALAGAALAIAAHLSDSSAPIVPPAVVIFIVFPASALALVGASALFWRDCLRRLTIKCQPVEPEPLFRKRSNSRFRVRPRHSGVRNHHRAHTGLPTTARRRS
jgi:hypothetical protein